jgi:hypothetical protein
MKAAGSGKTFENRHTNENTNKKTAGTENNNKKQEEEE